MNVFGSRSAMAAGLAAPRPPLDCGFADRLFGDIDAAKLRDFVRSLDRVLVEVEKRLGPPPVSSPSRRGQRPATSILPNLFSPGAPGTRGV